MCKVLSTVPGTCGNSINDGSFRGENIIIVIMRHQY